MFWVFLGMCFVFILVLDMTLNCLVAIFVIYFVDFLKIFECFGCFLGMCIVLSWSWI